MTFSEYIVYVDESGDHSLETINPDYPLFVLAFCVFHIPSYSKCVVPAIQSFKFKYFGHDLVILHENEIRKRSGAFSILNNREVRAEFMADLDDIIRVAPFVAVATVIDKIAHKAQGRSPQNPYHVALEFGLVQVFQYLQEVGQQGRTTRVVFESRGRKEDDDLELEFRRILDRTQVAGMADSLDFLCASKLVNNSGLQFADMIARPIGLSVLRPQQPNRAWETIRTKLRASDSGVTTGYEFKRFP